ncbi:flagellar hook-length control protein FliK [Pseudomonas zhanjiangensis]|uniref:Flagellar hook-length control protein FliK n=1 Tax=Pseudomonas zhanjiangensis TaxID=3239015 RepID=A0ABV3YUP6_9PSED
MPVAPDPLLRSAPEIKPKAAVAKAPAKAPEPRKSEASSFAQVYAKERQSKAAERSEAAAKPERKAEVDEPEVAADAAVEQPVIADGGNALPSDAQPEPPAFDPLLLMGMGGLPPASEESPQLDGEASSAAVGQLRSSGPASMTEASFDPELDALNQLPAVRMALELGAKAAAANQAGAPAVLAVQSAAGGGQVFAGDLLAKAVQQAQGELGEAGDVPLIELTAEGLEALKESVAETRPENFVSKLGAASQAIAQQAQAAPRAAALVPGQPVPMQQGGWSEQVVDRVMWMSSQNLKSADIQLDPAELGRLEVRINMNQDQTQVTFASANAGVRDALEGQMHRLRDLFTQQGMNLLDVNVSDQSLSRGWQGQDGDGRGRGGADQGLSGTADDELVVGSTELKATPAGGGLGMVDYYA